MNYKKEHVFACIDCETTGLDHNIDKIVEVAISIFNFKDTIETFSTLINPEVPINEDAIKVHGISQEDVLNAPTIKEALPKIHDLLKDKILVGHSLDFDIRFIDASATQNKVEHLLANQEQIDTLRMARYYGKSEINSLEYLCKHFGIQIKEPFHRALPDVENTKLLFFRLYKLFPSVEDLFDTLSRPIILRKMPFGKYKGFEFCKIPSGYLRNLMSKATLDLDLEASIKKSLAKRSSS